MVRIAPVRLLFNPKTLWFDAGDLELRPGDDVVVDTARGRDIGKVSDAVFEMEYEQTKRLKTKLMPVKALAGEDDLARARECEQKARDALPVFRQLAHELAPDMNPIAVEYPFGAEKAVFFFDADERIDFRSLVKRLSSELDVRAEMKQVGVRDGARMVGGLGHCGQELCCRRLGGDFNPVSIRMAKEQNLSLNPQKISGCCGRLMCCLRYEFDAYKDFHSRAPKKNARISTPDGEGKVVDLDVPREVVSIKVGDEKPVKVPLADMEPPAEGTRPNAVGEEAWERATEPPALAIDSALSLFTNELSGDDQLAEPGSLRHVHGEPQQQKPQKSRSRRRRGGGSGQSQQAQGQDRGRGQQAAKGGQQGKSRRRRSTTVKSEGASAAPKQQQQQKSQVGRNSSALRANRQDDAAQQPQGTGQRKRRRSHKANTSE